MELPADAVGTFVVTIGPPKSDLQQNQPEAAESPRVNLVLYKIPESAALKNQEIPAHGNPGARAASPDASACRRLPARALRTAPPKSRRSSRSRHTGWPMRQVPPGPFRPRRLATRSSSAD